MSRNILYLFIFLPLLLACGGKGGVKTVASSADSLSSCSPRYAKGYTVSETPDGIRLVDVTNPQDEDRMDVDYHFALVPKTMTGAVSVPEGYVRVDVPLERTIVMTMLQLASFTALDAHDVVRGITGTKNLFNEDMLQRVKDGRIVKIGMEGNFDPELILAAHPEAIFISPFKRGGYDAIKETGITLIPYLGYKELDPLGQAEWVRFVGLFIGKEHEADEVFAGIEQRYNSLKQRVDSLMQTDGTPCPSVFSGEMHGGNWYAVGGRNYLAQIFRDAGSRYVIDDENSGGVNIEFEKMYSLAADADYWRVLNSFPGTFSYDALLTSEPRNELFRAFRERRVIYCNMKQQPYYELTPVEPDVVLSDLVAIFHPELLPEDYHPTFYQLLK